MTATDPTLREIVETLAAGADGAERSDAKGAAVWSVEGREFAVLNRDGIELRLDRAIAAAAALTPDTSASSRGPDWVQFAPHDLDDHAIDRLEAWFGLAYRRVSA